MKLLFNTGMSTADILGQLDLHLTQNTPADYIYMYPPRQSYRSLSRAAVERILRHIQQNDEPLNLYIHVPYCRQICSFCNLYSVPSRGETAVDDYVEGLNSEISWLADLTQRSGDCDTIYVGGGTPSLASPKALAGLLETVSAAFGIERGRVPEVALEVAPDTVDASRLKDLRAAGFTRVNLGVQTTDDQELLSIGRKHGPGLALATLETALTVGFTNVCADLIYGLPGQSHESWESSVGTIAALRVPTVCAYPLTLRPHTGYARCVPTYLVSGPDQYRKYEAARNILEAAGYRQETHVRYVLSTGGYLQKERHWAGAQILGVGAGARSYTRFGDARNPYSIVRRRDGVRRYLSVRDKSSWPAWESGILLDENERIRRSIILGLLNIDRKAFLGVHGLDVLEFQPGLFSGLRNRGLLTVSAASVRLSEIGAEYRDIIVQTFFSDAVKRRIAEFSYDE